METIFRSLGSNLVVRCGEWDTQSEDEDIPFQELNVERIEVLFWGNLIDYDNSFV